MMRGSPASSWGELAMAFNVASRTKCVAMPNPLRALHVHKACHCSHCAHCTTAVGHATMRIHLRAHTTTPTLIIANTRNLV
jgi:hypothetical protein